MELASAFLEENRDDCFEFPEMDVRVLVRTRRYARGRGAVNLEFQEPR